MQKKWYSLDLDGQANKFLKVNQYESRIEFTELADASDGPQGYQGWQGDIGNDGPQGYQGDDGDQGTQGYQGWQGNIGNDGPQGYQGDDGRIGLIGYQGDVGQDGFNVFGYSASSNLLQLNQLINYFGNNVKVGDNIINTGNTSVQIGYNGSGNPQACIIGDVVTIIIIDTPNNKFTVIPNGNIRGPIGSQGPAGQGTSYNMGLGIEENDSHLQVFDYEYHYINVENYMSNNYVTYYLLGRNGSRIGLDGLRSFLPNKSSYTYVDIIDESRTHQFVNDTIYFNLAHYLTTDLGNPDSLDLEHWSWQIKLGGPLIHYVCFRNMTTTGGGNRNGTTMTIHLSIPEAIHLEQRILYDLTEKEGKISNVDAPTNLWVYANGTGIFDPTYPFLVLDTPIVLEPGEMAEISFMLVQEETYRNGVNGWKVLMTRSTN